LQLQPSMQITSLLEQFHVLLSKLLTLVLVFLLEFKKKMTF
jgi:hypothetical protein